MKILILTLLISTTTLASYSDIHQKFDYKKPGRSKVVEVIKDKKYYKATLEELNWENPFTEEPVKIALHFYRRKNSAINTPVIIIIPPILGDTVLERRTAKHFVKNGFHAVILESTLNPRDTSVPVNKFNEHFYTSVNSVFATVDHLKKRRPFRSSKIYLWGTSLGSLVGSLSFSIDKRISGATLLFGGANVADILSDSKQRFVKAYREHRMEVEGIKTVEKFRSLMKRSLPADVVDFAHRRSNQKLSIGLCLKDKSVPTRYQLSLWEAYNRPKSISYKLPHSLCIGRSHTISLKTTSEFIREDNLK